MYVRCVKRMCVCVCVCLCSQVLDAMEYAVYMCDVEHVVLDNLQFMLSGQLLRAGGGDKFDVICH